MKRFANISAAFCLALLLVGCGEDARYVIDPGTPVSGEDTRTATLQIRRVHLLYSAGYNSLSNYLTEDISDLETGFLPGTSSVEDVLLVFNRRTAASKDYNTPVAPVLMRLYADGDGRPVRDTLKVWPEDTRATSVQTMREVFNYVAGAFPAKGYGLVFSSHASGWLPPLYYNNPSAYDPSWQNSTTWSAGLRLSSGAAYPPMGDPSLPAVKSVGQDAGGESVELTLREMASAIPFRLDYIIFDACLMGGVEMAYELKDVAGQIAFSPTEVLAEGLNYGLLAERLTTDHTPDVVQVAKDYFAYYDAQSGAMNSATISVVDTRKLDGLATLCRELFATYRTGLDAVQGSQVQRYFRYNRHWFYDLRDILLHAGLSEEDDARLQAALDDAVVYKAATPKFIDSFSINVYSGLSMYLPADGSDYLDAYYKENVSWNDATGLVP